MRIDLTDTTSSKINSALMDARRASGSTAAGMVLTMVIVVDEGSAYDALKCANDASREHPSRILAVIKRAAVRRGPAPGPGWTPRSWWVRTPARARRWCCDCTAS